METASDILDFIGQPSDGKISVGLWTRRASTSKLVVADHSVIPIRKIVHREDALMVRPRSAVQTEDRSFRRFTDGLVLLSIT
jgi:hypothetical protein